MTWWTRLLRRNRLDRELDAELRFHVDEECARLVAEGVAPDEARRRALAAFGGLQPIAEIARDVRRQRWLEHLGQDVRYALRMMRRQPGFTLAAVLSLAIGIGANAAIFSVADALLLRALPVDRPEELSFINRVLPDEEHMRFSYPSFQQFAAGVDQAAFAAMASTAALQTTSDRGAEIVTGQLVSGNWFQLLGVAPAAGRTLVPGDAAGADGQPVVVLSHAYWQRRFAGDPAVVGSTLRVNAVPLTVVGVAAPAFSGMSIGYRVDLWMPLPLQHALKYTSNAAMDDAVPAKPWLPQAGITWLTVIMRAPPQRATAALARVSDLHRADLERRAVAAENRQRAEYVRSERLDLVPAGQGLSVLRQRFSAPLYVLIGAAAMVLLIGCANLASLLLARGAARTREVALRLSLGAGRGRIVRQLLTETIMLALIGGAGGLLLARWGADALLRLASSSGAGIPLTLPLDWRFLGFTFGVSVLTGLAFGLIPALKLARGAAVSTLQSGTRLTATDRRGLLPLGPALVVAQVALSITLVVGAILFLRTFRNLLAEETGFDSTILAAWFEPRLAGISQDQLPDLYDRLLGSMRRVPGARNAAIAMAGAVSGWQRISGIAVEGQPRRTGTDGSVREDFVSVGYFDTLGMTLVRGRGFTERDDQRAPRVAVVNEAMARKFFGDDDPIGKRFGYGSAADIEIVGVLRDARLDGVRRPPPPMVFYPLPQVMQFASRVYLRVSADSIDEAREGMRRAIAAADPNLAVREVATLGELSARTAYNERLLAQLTGGFGMLALAVACLGLYGSLSYSVARRTKELGVRLALGARPSAVRWQVLRESLTLVAIGATVGAAIAFASATWVASLLYGLSPRDPLTFALAVGVLLTVGSLAGLLPAWRASRVDPLIALRAD
jgi:predicted permease